MLTALRIGLRLWCEPVRRRLARRIAAPEIDGISRYAQILAGHVSDLTARLGEQSAALTDAAANLMAAAEYIAKMERAFSAISVSVHGADELFRARTGRSLDDWLSALEAETPARPGAPFRPAVVAGRDLERAARSAEEIGDA